MGAISVTDIWFLWSVLSCSIALAIAIKTFDNQLLQLLLVILLVYLVAIFPNWELNLYMYPYFVAGYFYARNKTIIKPFIYIAFLISIIAFVIMIFYFQKKHFIYTSGLIRAGSIIESFKIDLFRYVIGLFGSIAAIGISLVTFIKVKKQNFVVKLMNSLGMESLATYILSLSIQSFWLPYIINKLIKCLSINWNNYINIYSFILTPIISLFYALLLLWIIKKMKIIGIYRVLFGR